MPQFLIREFTDSTGRVFKHIEEARENECFTVIEADSKEEAYMKKEKQDKEDRTITCRMPYWA